MGLFSFLSVLTCSLAGDRGEPISTTGFRPVLSDFPVRYGRHAVVLRPLVTPVTRQLLVSTLHAVNRG